MQTGQKEHELPAGHFKNVVLDTSKTLPQTGLAVLLCQVVLAHPVPGRPKPPPRTQFCVSGRENLQTGQTEHGLPAGHFKNVAQNWSCRSVVLSSRVSTYPVPPDLAAAKKKIHRQMRAELSSAMRAFDQGLRSVWRCCCENQCREHIFSKTHTNEFCGK